MALGAIAKGNTVVPGVMPGAAFPGSVLSDWVTLHDTLAATAATGTVLKTLLSNASANVHYCRVPTAATRIMVRARYDIAVTALSTQPVIQLYSIFDTGIYGDPAADLMTGTEAAPAFANDGTVRWMRTDALTIAAAGTTLTCAPSTDSLDATYGYGDPAVNAVTSGITFDCVGGGWVALLVKTAAVVSGGAGTIVAQGLFLN